MDEARSMDVCHEAACLELREDHSDVASTSGTSGGSACSLASNLSDDASYSPPDDSSGSSSASSSTLHLDSEGPLCDLSSLLAQLPARYIMLRPPAQVFSYLKFYLTSNKMV
jgi:hypothetical protein